MKGVGGGIGVTGLLLVLALPTLAGVPPGKYVSWADSRHRYGWTRVESGSPTFKGERDLDPPCGGARAGEDTDYVCSTDDGGRTWRKVFQAGSPLACLGGYTRTSRTAGVASVGCESYPRTVRNGVFWTIDNGRHWYETTRIGNVLAGRGRRLFWTDQQGQVLYEVSRWPPRRPPRCRGFFSWHPYDQRPRRNGSVCVGAVENAGVRSRPIADLRGEGPFVSFRWLKPIPDGVAAVIHAGQSLRVLLRRADAQTIVELPDQPSGVTFTAVVFDGRWPFLRLRAGALSAGGQATRHEWKSPDGGRTWRRVR